MRIVLSLLFSGFLIFLSGCASQAAFHAATKKSNECKISSCLPRYNTCMQQCKDSCRTCHQSSQQSASRHYFRYKHEHHVTGEFIGRELKSYRDQLQCRKVSCNCIDDYSVCAQSCEGEIHKRLQVSSICC